MTWDDLRRFRALPIDHGAIGLEWDGNDVPYFCTPAGAEFVGRIGCDGVHFIVLPGDERIFCVDPAMGEPGTYVLPVAEDFKQFLSFVLFCRDASPISQIWWLEEKRFRQLLAEDEKWTGSGDYQRKKEAALAAVQKNFAAAPADPFYKVKELQAGFNPSVLRFSDEYYDVLGLTRS